MFIFQLEHLLKNVPFTLQTLNLEGCDLDDRDLRFLARSHHKVQCDIFFDQFLISFIITSLSIGLGHADGVELRGSRPGRKIRWTIEADIGYS